MTDVAPGHRTPGPPDGEHLAGRDLAEGLVAIGDARTDEGPLQLIVRRPAVDAREVLATAVLDPIEGLVGDTWRTRGSRRRARGTADPDRQLTLVNAAVAGLIAGTPERRALFGDQLFVDLDLSEANLPPGTRLAVGAAIVEITAAPHTGCAKFAARFGPEALRFVNEPEGRRRRRRGANARGLEGGPVRVGDAVVRLNLRPP